MQANITRDCKTTKAVLFISLVFFYFIYTVNSILFAMFSFSLNFVYFLFPRIHIALKFLFLVSNGNLGTLQQIYNLPLTIS